MRLCVEAIPLFKRHHAEDGRVDHKSNVCLRQSRDVGTDPDVFAVHVLQMPRKSFFISQVRFLLGGGCSRAPVENGSLLLLLLWLLWHNLLGNRGNLGLVDCSLRLFFGLDLRDSFSLLLVRGRALGSLFLNGSSRWWQARVSSVQGDWPRKFFLVGGVDGISVGFCGRQLHQMIADAVEQLLLSCHDRNVFVRMLLWRWFRPSAVLSAQLLEALSAAILGIRSRGARCCRFGRRFLARSLRNHEGVCAWLGTHRAQRIRLALGRPTGLLGRRSTHLRCCTSGYMLGSME